MNKLATNILIGFMTLGAAVMLAARLEKPTWCSHKPDGEIVQCGLKSKGLCEAHHDGLGYCRREKSNDYYFTLKQPETN